MARGPILIELDKADEAPSVADAPPVPDPVSLDSAQGQAMQAAARLAARKPSRLSRLFWGLAAALLGTFVSIAVWDFVTSLLLRNTYLGWAVTGLCAAFLLVSAIVCLREIAALGRLKSVDALRARSKAAFDGNLDEARRVSKSVVSFYNGRADTKWGRERLSDLAPDQLDAPALLSLIEVELLAPLDAAASREVEAAARQVASVTALVPLALADVIAALVANVRMIRRIAEIYGGRSGTLGSWRLMRAVLSHMVATGAVAVGDDMLEPVVGSSILGKISRRFGEGLVNGALTARVGVAAMEVCRPMPFGDKRRPKVRSLIKNALSGMVTSVK